MVDAYAGDVARCRIISNKAEVRQDTRGDIEVGERIVLAENRSSRGAYAISGNHIAGEGIAQNRGRVGWIGAAGGGIVYLILIFRPAQAIRADLCAQDCREITGPHGRGQCAGEIGQVLGGAESLPVAGKPGIVLAVEARQADRTTEENAVLVLA